jgi:hypothetical protein
MRGRPTLLLLVILAVLAGYVWKYERGKPSGAELEQQARVLLSVEADRVDKVTIDSERGRLELWKSSDGEWRMLQPVDDRADLNAVAALLQLLNPLEATRRVPGDRGSMVTYRLDRPDVVATFRVPRVSGFKEYELRVGRLNPAFDGHYAIVDNDTTRLGLLDRWFVESHLLRDPMAYRFRRITQFKVENTRRVVVQQENEPRVVLERDIETQWRVREPVDVPADQVTVNQLIRRLTTQRIATFVHENPPSIDVYGLDSPTLSLHVVLDDQSSTLLTVGDPVPGLDGEGELYAKRAARPKVFTIAASSLAELSKSLFDLRDRRVLPFAPSGIDSFTVTAAGQTLRAHRRGTGDWVDAGGVPLNGLVIEQALQNLSVVAAVEFDDAADAGARSGLARPDLEVLVYDRRGTERHAVFREADPQRSWARRVPDGSIGFVENVDIAQLRTFAATPPRPTTSR